MGESGKDAAMLHGVRALAISLVITGAGGALFGGVAALALRDTGPAGQWYDRDTSLAFLAGYTFHLCVAVGLTLGSALGARWGASRKAWSLVGSAIACAAAVVAVLTICIRAVRSVPPLCAVSLEWSPVLGDLLVVLFPAAAAGTWSLFIWKRGTPKRWRYALAGGTLTVAAGIMLQGYLDPIVEYYFWHC